MEKIDKRAVCRIITGMNTTTVLDPVDFTLLRVLQAGGRLSFADLAAAVDLSPAATGERVRRLEERGVISSYHARLAPAAVDAGMLAFVEVTLAHPKHRAGFLRTVAEREEILECHHVTGDYDYLLKIRCRDAGELNTLIGDHLKGMGAELRSRTMIALGTAKETSALPLPPLELPKRAGGRRTGAKR